MAESSYVKLTGNFFFDPAQKVILKKVGDRYIQVLHDRRRSSRPVAIDRRKRADENQGDMRPLGRGLYWDKKSKDIYRKAGDNLVLFTKDRRKGAGPRPENGERRS
jgi:hypothetical protein